MLTIVKHNTKLYEFPNFASFYNTKDMFRAKYKYNPSTLSYERSKLTWKDWLLRLTYVLVPTLVLSGLIVFLFLPTTSGNTDKNLKRQNMFLTQQLEDNQKEMKLIKDVLQDIEKRDKEIYRVVFNADKFPDNIKNMGTGGSDKYKSLEGFDASDLAKKTARELDDLEKQLYAQAVSFDQLVNLAKEKEKMLAFVPAIQPVANKDLRRMASGYGWRIDPVYGNRRMHWGMDFTATTGTDVYATGNGVVKDIEQKSWGYGNSVIIDHGFGYTTRYAHLSAFKVKKGQKVKRGDLIGLVGSSGKSTAPHLHYEVEKNGQKVNPVNYYHSDLSPEEYERMLELSRNANRAFD